MLKRRRAEGRPDTGRVSKKVAAPKPIEEALQERERDLQEARAHLAAIIESSDDAIVSKTLDGVIKSWNRAAEKMFGYTADEAIGQLITLIIPPERHAEENDVLARLRRGERIDHFETVRQAKDGRRLDVSLTVSPIKDSQGRVIGASKIARDTTERKRLLQREQEARRDAEHALRAKEEFIATVSHELRSPLTAIVGWTHLLQGGGLDEDGTRRAIETISRNAAMQSQLISDILDVQRLASGRFRVDIQEMDLAFAIEAALDTVRPAAQARGIALTPVLGTLPPISGDPDRIQQIVWNLLSNAVKFAPNGGRVHVYARHLESQVEVSVEDDGPGVNPAFLPFVFERFRQDEAGRRKGGLGLGLAIVRHLVELHGGTVSAANREEGTGAVFTVRLPLTHVAHVDAVVSPEPGVAFDAVEEAAALHGTRVLVVDDEPDAREVVAAVLGECGADVMVAKSARDAPILIARERPDVLVCDISMPEQDGYSLLRTLRALPESEGGRTPAVALTAVTTTDDRVRALRTGFQSFIPKPVHPAELAAVIASIVRERAE